MRPDALLAVAPPETYFEWGTLITFGGATGSALAVGIVVGAIFGGIKVRTMAALLWSLALLLYLASQSTAPAGGEKWFIAVANAFLVTASALGLNTAAGGQGGGDQARRARNRFIGPWW